MCDPDKEVEYTRYLEICCQEHSDVQHFLTNFFRGVFGQARRYLDWLCCVALCCILLSASYCFVLCCVVM